MLFLRLFHGRANPEQKMEDWGRDGPVFGPLVFVHTTYGFHIKMGLPDGNCNELYTVNDMLFYDKVYYGDWSVFTQESFLVDGFQVTEYNSEKAQRYTART